MAAHLRLSGEEAAQVGREQLRHRVLGEATSRRTSSLPSGVDGAPTVPGICTTSCSEPLAAGCGPAAAVGTGGSAEPRSAAVRAGRGLPQLLDRVGVRGLDVRGDHLRFHRDHEDHVGEVAGQETR